MTGLIQAFARRTDKWSSRSRGTLSGIFGVLVLSFDALLIRLVDASGWDVIFWRGFLICLVMTLLASWQGQWKDFLAPVHRRAAFLAAFLYGLGMLLFVMAITHTKVANAVVILTSAPFFAALFSWWLLREMIRTRTVLAIVSCMVGVAVVFSSSMQSGSWIGDAVALVLAVSTGLALTILRQHPGIPRIPMIAVSGMIAALLTYPMAQPLSLATSSYGWLAVMGLIQMPVASVLLLVATRYLPSPEVSLFLLIETVLGPIWVWWVLGEVPPSLALAGGVIVVLTITLHSTVALRESADLRS